MSNRKARWKQMSLSAACLLAALPAAVQAGGAAAPSPGKQPLTSPASAAGGSQEAPWVGPKPAEWQLSERFGIYDQNPEAYLPDDKEENAHPMEFGYFLQDLITRAEAARKNKDYPAVVKYYRAVAKAAPNRATGWSKLCEAYELVGDNERGARACRYAMDREGASLQDYVRFVNLSVAKEGDLAPAEIKDLNAAIDHLHGEPHVEVVISLLSCQVAVKAKDVAAMEACTAELDKLAPNDPKTVIFKWSLAIEKGQRAEAAKLLDRAKELGVVPESLERMRGVAVASRLHMPPFWAVAGAVLLVSALGLALWTVRRKRSFAHH